MGIENNKFDVIISVGWRDFIIVKKTVKYIQKNICPESIYLILKKKAFHFFNQKYCNNNHVILIDEDQLLSDLSFQEVRIAMQKAGIGDFPTGWYFQQFLKMGFAFSKYAKQKYLIWDADTLPINKLSFLNRNHILFTPKTEYHQPYFELIKNMLGFSKKVDYSFIAEHMMIETSIMQELITIIGQVKSEGSSWYEKILYSVDKNAANGFSEFETYGTFCTYKYPDLYQPQLLNTYRDAGKVYGRCITRHEIDNLSKIYDTISLELRDVPPFPRNIYNIMQKLVLSWYRKK